MVAWLPILTDSSRQRSIVHCVCVQVLPRHAPWRVSAAPRSVTRQTLPRHRSAASVVATSSSYRATMYGAAQAFRRTMAIGTAKSVSFEEKTVLDLKLVLKSVKKDFKCSSI